MQYSATPDVVGGTVFNSTVALALLGVNEYADNSTGSVADTSFNGMVMGNYSRELNCDVNGELIIPIYVGSNSTNAKIVTDTQSINLTALGATLNSDDSGEQVFYATLNATNLDRDWETSTLR